MIQDPYSASNQHITHQAGMTLYLTRSSAMDDNCVMLSLIAVILLIASQSTVVEKLRKKKLKMQRAAASLLCDLAHLSE
jgi:hypothetical protein